MAKYFLKRRFLPIFCLFFLLVFLFLPKIGLANDFEEISVEEIENYIQLPEKDIQNLLHTLIEKFTTKWIYLESSGYSTAEERAVPLILREAGRAKVLNYLLVDAPIDVAGKVIKNAVEIARILLAEDISVALDKFEKETVKKATEYGMKVLLQNEIRVAAEAIKFKYISQKGETKEVVFQYIIIYKPLDIKNGKVEIRFYSPNSIEPPKSTVSMQHSLREELPPFIVEISGEVEKTDLGAYNWIKGPLIKIDFPESVPDLGIKPLSFWERHLIEPIKTTIKDIEVIIAKITGKSLNLTENIFDLPQAAYNIWNKIKSIFSNLNPFTAQVAKVPSLPSEQEEITRLQEKIEEIEKEAELRETEILEDKSTEEKLGESEALGEQLREFVEDLGKMSEEMDRINKKIAELSKEQDDEEEEDQEEEEEQLGEELTQTLPKILISEVCAGLDKSQNEFVELYNPNDSDINLDDESFKLKLVNSGNNVAEKQLSWNKNIIPAKGYFLLVGGKLVIDSQELEQDAEFISQLTGTSGVIITDVQDNILDKVSWGKEGKLPPSAAVKISGIILENGLKTGKSLERKSQTGTLINTDDNSDDFALNSAPSPTNSLGEKKVYRWPVYSGGGGGGGGGSSSGGGGDSGGTSEPQFFPVIINEIMYDLEGGDEGREWIEIFNNGETQVDLTDWKFYEYGEDANHRLEITQGSSTLQPNEYAVIVDDSEEFLKDYPDYSGTLFDSSFSLNNSGENIAIKNRTLLIDEVSYSSEWEANGDGNSLQRVNPEGDSNDSDNWQPVPPTPGQENSFPGEEEEEESQPILEVSCGDKNPCQNLEFNTTESGENPESQILTINNIGTGTLEWTLNIEYTSPPVDGVEWLKLSPDFGTAPTEVSVSVENISTLLKDTYLAEIAVIAEEAQGSPQNVKVNLTISEEEEVLPEDLTTEGECIEAGYYWYDGSCHEEEKKIPQTVLISEVLASGNKEFVELYNFGEQDIDISNWYFSYFSLEKNWNEPHLNKPFSESENTSILAGEYYLISLGDYPDKDENPKVDWKPYEAHLNNDNGSVAIFSCDPKYNEKENPIFAEGSKSCKIDALGWKKSEDSEEPQVKEERAGIAFDEDNKSLARKLGLSKEEGKEGYLVYIDSDNNKNDFEPQEPTPKEINKSSYSDLDGDGIIDSYDPETIITSLVELEAGEYNFKDLIIKNGGKLILNSDSSLEGFKGVGINAENLIVDSDSSISANGKGYVYKEGSIIDQGPGAGSGSGGAGYGGNGGILGSDSGGSSYGLLRKPIELGSAGGGYYVARGGAGGGAIKIEVQNTLTLNGIISANGGDGNSDVPSGTYSGGGSGGSIYITTNILIGSGIIKTNGGDGGKGSGYGGGGGRIALYYDSKGDFSGETQTFGGNGAGAGTVFLKSSGQNVGDLIIDNNNCKGITSLSEADNTFDNVQIVNEVHLNLSDGLNVTNSLQIENGVILEVEERTAISVNNFTLKSDSKLLGNFNITANNFIIDSDSSILTDGKGFLAGCGQGAGNLGSHGGSGAGYGGKGGDCYSAQGGSSYGSLKEPTDLGSGGGGFTVAPGGAGGGAIKIEVQNTLTLNGIISANGGDGSGSGGGGSGGSIWIISETLTGSGLIMTNGGDSEEGGGGAGGRVAIEYNTNNFNGDIQVNGGTGQEDGEEGTKIMEQK